MITNIRSKETAKKVNSFLEENDENDRIDTKKFNKIKSFYYFPSYDEYFESEKDAFEFITKLRYFSLENAYKDEIYYWTEL